MGQFDSLHKIYSFDIFHRRKNYNFKQSWNTKRTKEYCLELGHCTLFSGEVKIRAWFWFMAH